MIGAVVDAEAPGSVPGRSWTKTAVDLVGPVVTAAAIGAVLVVTSTPAPGEELAAFALYAATAIYVTGMIWDVIGAAGNARARRRSETARRYSSCLFGLVPFAVLVVALSAAADGEGWIFDWRLALVAVVAANLVQFLVFTRFSHVGDESGSRA